MKIVHKQDRNTAVRPRRVLLGSTPGGACPFRVPQVLDIEQRVWTLCPFLSPLPSGPSSLVAAAKESSRFLYFHSLALAPNLDAGNFFQCKILKEGFKSTIQAFPTPGDQIAGSLSLIPNPKKIFLRELKLLPFHHPSALMASRGLEALQMKTLALSEKVLVSASIGLHSKAAFILTGEHVPF